MKPDIITYLGGLVVGVAMGVGASACTLAITIGKPKAPEPPKPASSLEVATVPLQFYVYPMNPPDPEGEALTPGDPPYINLCRPGCLMPGVKVM